MEKMRNTLILLSGISIGLMQVSWRIRLLDCIGFGFAYLLFLLMTGHAGSEKLRFNPRMVNSLPAGRFFLTEFSVAISMSFLYGTITTFALNYLNKPNLWKWILPLFIFSFIAGFVLFSRGSLFATGLGVTIQGVISLIFITMLIIIFIYYGVLGGIFATLFGLFIMNFGRLR